MGLTAIAFGRRLVLAGFLASLAGCGERDMTSYRPALADPPVAGKVAEYKFGVVPMENFRHIFEVYQPIVDYLNARLPGARLTLEVPRGLGEHAEQLHQRQFGFALSNPYQTWRAVQRDGYHVFGKMGDDEAFRGIWMVRRDSGLRNIEQLRGRAICFPPKSALAATMMTEIDLLQHGIDVRTDVTASYVGGQESSIMQVYLKGAAAGATWPLAWMSFQRLHPREAAELEVRWPTPPLINQGLVVRDDVPPPLVARVAELLATLHETREGRAMLERLPIHRFEHADDASYAVVGRFVDTYTHTFKVAELP